MPETIHRCLYGASREGLICYVKCQYRGQLDELKNNPLQWKALDCQLPKYRLIPEKTSEQKKIMADAKRVYKVRKK